VPNDAVVSSPMLPTVMVRRLIVICFSGRGWSVDE
jgi:hypothetical protein